MMDKSWISKPRNTSEYVEGLNRFLDFAFANNVEGKIICPCPKCKFRKWHVREVVHEHLIVKPFPQGYTFWAQHGETLMMDPFEESVLRPHKATDRIILDNPMHDMVHDAFGVHTENERVEVGETFVPSMDNETKELYELLEDGQQSLYEGCEKFTKLSFLIRLYHIKCMCGITDKAMSMILELLADAFEHAKIPTSFYEAKKTINKLGLNYTKIHACPNDCMLYWGDDKNRDACKKCNASRWKQKGKGVSSESGMRKKQPVKILRYFPLKPRLQRLFLSSKTSKHMRWHVDEKNNDGLLRHPRDSEAWKMFDLTNEQFSCDPRNVRLGLATDGFNPFGTLSTSYSIWPVVLINYNLPPWMCMKQSSLIMSMIIPGKGAPGNDIDVYLQPLIEELKELWTVGVETYDAHAKDMFNMRAALLWTISDFPGLGTLSGWNTYTGLACPTCNFDSISSRLSHSRKWCFMGHR